ncbi:hypothetical protein DFQ28_001893 [Apophysomyces sp. BC1034]|nr:hypothetical protein DFQ30_007524 [Apophysomyces sp. BC1015]KAG0177541.1 hypothetical protein DFQ29_004699 [Apophysomyces sp. BC1021]KAG0190561.1 hypothetical protein DFQ28_001893 [Apophysomyces sp. BC1034]
MYFHNSGYRHEKKYASLRSSHRARTSTEHPTPSTSTDSGYSSSSLPSLHDTTGSTTTTATSPVTPRARKKQQQKTDLVYSCPRPLAFPFHNDCHFLPVAEADPRDIARISPPPRRTSSVGSSQSDNLSIQSGSSDPLLSRQTSVRRSTVSSVEGERLAGTGIKKGTVKSLRQLFNKSAASLVPPKSSPSPPRPSPPTPEEPQPLKAKFTGFSMTPIASRLGLSRASNKTHPFAVAFAMSASAAAQPEDKKPQEIHNNAPAVEPARPKEMLPKAGTQKLLAAFAFWDTSVQRKRKHQPSVVIAKRSEPTEPIPPVQPWKSTSWQSLKTEAKELKSSIALRIQAASRQHTPPCPQKEQPSVLPERSCPKKPGEEPKPKKDPTIVGRWWKNLKTMVVGNKTSRVGVM